MILPILKLIRLYYTLPFTGGFIVILFYLTGGNFYGIWEKAAISCISLIFVISGGYVLNDVCDLKIDKINSPGRIIAAEKIQKNSAVILGISFMVISIIFGAFCNFLFCATISGIAALLVFYDLFSKRIGIFKNIIVAILITSLYPLAFTVTAPAATPRLGVLYIHPGWLFFSVLGYEMLKDIRDIKGDSEITGRQFAYRRGRTFLTVARMFIVAGSLITLLPFILGYCNYIYLVASAAAIVLAVVSTRYKPIRAIHLIYAEIFLVTAGAMADLLVFGP